MKINNPSSQVVLWSQFLLKPSPTALVLGQSSLKRDDGQKVGLRADGQSKFLLKPIGLKV